MNQALAHVGKKSLIVSIGNVLGKVFSFFFAIVVGRLLGAKSYGEYIFITSFLSFFVVVSHAGLNNGIMHFLPRYLKIEDTRKQIGQFVLTFSALASLFLCLLLFVFSHSIATYILGDPQYRHTLLILIPSVFLLALEHTMLSIIRASKRIKEVVYVNNLIIPLSKLTLLVLFYFALDVRSIYSLIVPYYLYSAAVLIYLFFRLKKYRLIGSWSCPLALYKDMLRYSLPLMLSGIIMVLTTHIDQFMIGYYLASAQVGIYRVASQFAVLTSIAYISLRTTIDPVIADLYHQKKWTELKEMYVVSTKWVSLINLFIFGLFFVFATDLLGLVGREFVSGSTVLILIALGQIVNSLTGTAANINNMTGHPRYALYTKLVVVFGNISLNIWLIPLWGINGAAIATMISLMVSNGMNLAFLYHHLRIQPYNRSYLKIPVALLVSTGCLHLFLTALRLPVLLRLIVGSAVYVLVFFSITYLFVLSPEERTWMEHIWKIVRGEKSIRSLWS